MDANEAAVYSGCGMHIDNFRPDQGKCFSLLDRLGEVAFNYIRKSDKLYTLVGPFLYKHQRARPTYKTLTQAREHVLNNPSTYVIYCAGEVLNEHGFWQAIANPRESLTTFLESYRKYFQEPYQKAMARIKKAQSESISVESDGLVYELHSSWFVGNNGHMSGALAHSLSLEGILVKFAFARQPQRDRFLSLTGRENLKMYQRLWDLLAIDSTCETVKEINQIVADASLIETIGILRNVAVVIPLIFAYGGNFDREGHKNESLWAI